MASSGEDRQRDLERTAKAIRACTLCRLHATRTHAVPGEGRAGATVMLVGEAPGRDEDASGRPFVGRAGRILDAALKGADLARESIFITNLVKCRPPGNRRPKRDEWESCRPYLLGQIAAVQPQAIVTLGATALRGLMGPGHELREARRETLRFAGLPVFVTYHPAAVFYNRKLEAALQNDLRAAAHAVARAPRRLTPRASSGRRISHGRAATR